MDKKFLIAIVFALVCLAINGVYDAYKEDPAGLMQESKQADAKSATQDNDQNSNNEKIKNNGNKIVVYIEGAIAKPGLVYLKGDARIGEVVEMAGGLTANADVKNLNMADKVTDGQKITIPLKKHNNNSSEEKSADPSEKSDIININTATAEELQKLPRVGPATAKNIIEYREKHGKFKTVEEIKNVPRIGDKTFEKFKDKIKV